MSKAHDAAALSRCLADAGYTREGVSAFLGPIAWDALARISPAPAKAICEREQAHPLSALVRAFWLGQPVEADALAAALTHAGASAAEGLGLVATDGERATPLVTLRSVSVSTGAREHEFLVASDRDELCGVSPLPNHHVLGVGGSTRTLISLLPDSASRALDLGCGCGIVALQLSQLADEVIATDISERALWFTGLNAALNGIESIETRLGSLFDPVADERFDLIASNPPFVITPRSEEAAAYEYRDAGRTGDALMLEVVEGLSRHLTPGGQARMLGNWEGDVARMQSAAVGLSGFVIERERLDPARYAELWIRDGGTPVTSSEGESMLRAWVADFASRGTASIGLGWVVLQEGNGPIETEALAHAVDPRWLSEHFTAALAAQAALTRINDDSLAELHLVVSSDVVESRHARPGAAGPNVIELRQGGALQRTLTADTALSAFVGVCDGELAVGQIIHALAALLEVDAEALLAQLLPQIRSAIVSGILHVEEPTA